MFSSCSLTRHEPTSPHWEADSLTIGPREKPPICCFEKQDFLDILYLVFKVLEVEEISQFLGEKDPIGPASSFCGKEGPWLALSTGSEGALHLC